MNTDLSEIKKGLVVIRKAIDSKMDDPSDRVEEYFSKHCSEIEEKIEHLVKLIE